MADLSKDLIQLLQYLLPGFLAAWVFYSLTSYPKPSQFERVIQALVFTLIIQGFVFFTKLIFTFVGNYWSLGVWDNKTDLGWSTIDAFLLGLLFSYFANNDKFHKLLRKAKITRESSYPSEWFGAFLCNITFIVLHLQDERRLYGWPTEWPSEPSSGHFVLEQVSWIVDGKDIPITGVSTMVVDVKDVKWVEFMEKSWEKIK
jgi:hypothetical protein